MFPSGIVPITGLLLTLVSSSLEVQAATGNTTKCADGAFDLYIQEVGETPCAFWRSIPSGDCVFTDGLYRQNL